MRKQFVILTLVFFASSFNSLLAYDENVHRKITEYVADLNNPPFDEVLTEKLWFIEGFDAELTKGNESKTIKEWIVFGSAAGDYGKKRWGWDRATASIWYRTEQCQVGLRETAIAKKFDMSQLAVGYAASRGGSLGKEPALCFEALFTYWRKPYSSWALTGRDIGWIAGYWISRNWRKSGGVRNVVRAGRKDLLLLYSFSQGVGWNMENAVLIVESRGVIYAQYDHYNAVNQLTAGFRGWVNFCELAHF
jgi:hypothetical protein